MLPQENRLRRSRDFARTRRHGRSCGSPLVALYVLPIRPPTVRVGFSVSKRVGKATTRNRVKRHLREATRHYLHSVRPGRDIVFIARPAAAGANFHEVSAVVGALLARAGALQPISDSASHG